MPEPATDNAAPNGQATTDDFSVDKFLDELSLKDDGRVTQLEGELNSLRGEMHRQQEVAAFEKYASELQDRLPSHLELGWARTHLLARLKRIQTGICLAK